MTEPTQRRMVLTDADILAIARKVDEIHKCRYDIEPDRLQKVFEFVESFYDGTMETKKTVRTAAIHVAVWGTIGALLLWINTRFPIIRAIIKFLSGGN